MQSCIAEASVGIRHICLVGNAVGIKPLPLVMGRAEYASVVEKIESEEDKALLNLWYEKEDGCVPVRYKLRPALFASPVVQGGADFDDLRFKVFYFAQMQNCAVSLRWKLTHYSFECPTARKKNSLPLKSTRRSMRG